jgi:hypothetical protein
MLFIPLVLLYAFIHYVGMAISEWTRKSPGACHRCMGALFVVVASVVIAFMFYQMAFDPALYARLTPFKQGEYVSYIVSTPIWPAVFVLIGVAFRGWRQKRKAAEATYREQLELRRAAREAAGGP